MEEKRKINGILAIIAELLIVVVLSSLILGTLNYFGIIPLSQSIKFLSFLPKQQQLAPNTSPTVLNSTINTRPFFTKAVVEARSPKEFVNTSNESVYKPLASSSAKFKGPIRIDLEIYVDNRTESSGVIFTNGFEYSDKAYKAIRIYHNSQNKNWSLEYRSQGKSTYTFLAKVTGNQFIRKFGIEISPDGKSLTVLTSSVASTNVSLSDSFYDAERKIFAIVQVAPNSELDLHSLYYQY